MAEERREITDAFDQAWQGSAEKRSEAVQKTPELGAAMSQIGQVEREYKNAPEMTKATAVSTLAAKLSSQLESGQEITEARQADSNNVIKPRVETAIEQKTQTEVTLPENHLGKGVNPPEGYYQVGLKDGTIEYRETESNRRAFIDHGSHIQVTGQSARDIEAAMHVVKERGWQAIDFEGSTGFKRETYAQARTNEIETPGYKPDREAKERLYELQQGRSQQAPEQKQREYAHGY